MRNTHFFPSAGFLLLFLLSSCHRSVTAEENFPVADDSPDVSATDDLDSLYNMACRAYYTDDMSAALAAITRGRVLSRRQGLTDKEALFDFYYGLMQTWLGQEDEGVEKMQKSLHLIEKVTDSIMLLRLPVMYKEMASAHIAVEDLEASIDDCLRREETIDRVAEIGADTAFLDHQRGSNAIMLATLYDFVGQHDTGRQWLERFMATRYAESDKGAHGLLDYYNSTDQAQKYIETFEQAKSYFGGDTFNIRYRDEIKYLINAYHFLDNTDGIVDGIQRVICLDDSILARTLRSNSLKLQEEYKLKEAQAQVRQERMQRRRIFRMALTGGLSLLIILGLLLRFNMQIRRKNRILSRQTNRANELEMQLTQRRRRRAQSDDAMDPGDLADRLNEWLDTNDRFLEKVTIQEAATALRVTQKRITHILETQDRYRSLEDWAVHKRVMRACKLIVEHPEFTIESIASDAGFNSPRTFYRKFQAETGLTPTEYRQSVKGRNKKASSKVSLF